MQQVSSGKKDISKQAQNASSSIRDTAEHFASDASNKASQMMEKATDTANEYMSEANSWVQENYGKTLGVVGVLTVVGLAGFLIGRSANKKVS